MLEKSGDSFGGPTPLGMRGWISARSSEMLCPMVTIDAIAILNFDDRGARNRLRTQCQYASRTVDSAFGELGDELFDLLRCKRVGVEQNHTYSVFAKKCNSDFQDADNAQLISHSGSRSAMSLHFELHGTRLLARCLAS